MSEFTVAKVRAEIERNTGEWLADLRDNGVLYDAVLAAMPHDAVVHVDANYYFRISASGDKHVLSGCIRAMRIHGFTSTQKPVANSPSFIADYRNDEARINLCFTSKSCRRVKVGTKMVEQDIFETVCDETILPETRPEEAAA